MQLRKFTILMLLIIVAGGKPVNAAYNSANRHVEFSGASYISIPNTAVLNGVLTQIGTVSFDAWIKPSSFANFPTIIGNTWNTGYWLGLNSNGQLRFYPGSSTLYESNAAVSLNVWTHVAVTYSDKDNEVRFYINGALDRVVSGVNVALGTSNSDLRIGADRQGANAEYYFNGGIDEVRIWGSVINFAAGVGLLYRIPHVFGGGMYGRSLLAAWRLNGDAADSTGSNNGSVIGALSYPAGPGSTHYNRICPAFTNNGNTGLDYFSIPSAAGNSFPGSYSIEMWVYIGSGGAANTFQTFVCKGSVPSNSFSYWLGVNKQNSRLRFVPNGNWANALESSDPLPAGQWVHVAATYSYGGNTGTARVFINGQERGSQGFNGAAPFSQSPLLVGAADMQALPVQAYALAGRLDELRLWSVARSAADIANSHRIEFEGNISGLSGVYHFDGDILDASPLSNHGTNFNAASSGLYFLDAGDLPALASILVAAPNGGENWAIGSTRQISWNAVGIATVTVELSRDGGATFGETLVSGAAAGSGYSWPVTGPETATARVRVRTNSVPELSDISNSDFVIASPPPFIAVAPGQLAFNAVQNGAIPAVKDLQLNNTGAGVLSWNISWSGPWLYASQTIGIGNNIMLQVGVNSTILPPGVYSDTLVLTGNASNMPFRVPVSYTIVSVPELAAEPAAMQFAAQPGVNPPTQFVKIRNAGTGVLSWTAVSNAPWMSIVPTSGAAGDSIELSVDVTGLPPSTYSGSITFSGNAANVPFVLPVQLVVSIAAYYPVSGRVESSGVPLANVSVHITGDSTLTLLTGNDGSFAVAGLRAGSYIVTASSAMYAFTPLSYTLSGLLASRTDLDFFGNPRAGSAMLHYKAGWNLISLPADPPDGFIVSLLPDAAPAKAWRYAPDTGYVEVTSLVFGTGYWIKFSRSDSVRIDGLLRGDLRLSLAGEGGGWNLVGCSSGPIDITTIRQTPADALLYVFQFDTGRGYRLPPGNMLQPGRGYYVKVRGDASLGLTTPAFAPPPDSYLQR